MRFQAAQTTIPVKSITEATYYSCGRGNAVVVSIFADRWCFMYAEQSVTARGIREGREVDGGKQMDWKQLSSTECFRMNSRIVFLSPFHTLIIVKFLSFRFTFTYT